MNSLAVDPINSDIVYAGGYWYDQANYTLKPKILKSTNGGINWSEKISGITGDGIINILVIDPTAPNIIYAGATDAVYKSTDKAEIWMNIGCDNVYSLVINPNSTDMICAGTRNGVYMSVDAGVNWSEMNEGLTVAYVTALALDPVQPDKIYAATYGGGVFTQEIAVEVEEKDNFMRLPKKFTLYQNYPNPFNATTQIKYSIPQTSDVRINIYNINGSLVRTLYNGVQQPGFHIVEWEGCDEAQKILSTGVYFCQLTVRGITLTNKMLLMK